MKTKQLILLTAITISLTSCGNSTHKTTKSAKGTLVETIRPQQTNKHQITSNGKIEANEIAQLGTRIMGTIKKIYVKKGQSVSKGALLLSISDEELQAKAEQAEAMVEQAEAAFKIAQRDEKRFSRLLAQKSVSQKEYENVHLHYKGMQAKLKMAQQMKREVKANRAYTQIRAPFAGNITANFAKTGSLASPGRPLITLEKKDNMVIQTQVSENVISQLKTGDLATVIIKATQQTFQAPIRERSLSSVATGGRYNLTLEVPRKEQEKLLSGMHATITYTVNATTATSKSLWIPQSAVIDRSGLKGVYTVSAQQEALLHWVRLGKTRGNLVEVLSGIAPDAQVILSHQKRIQNGTPVQLKK